jgi:tetratricopeptide (TPR) repeat protein
MKSLLTAVLIAVSIVADAQSEAEKAALGLAQAGKTEEAIVAFEKIVVAEPKNTGAADALAQLFYSKGAFRESYNTALKGQTAAPESASLSITRAKAAIKLDKSDEAIQLMDGLINVDGSYFYPHYVKAQALDAQDQIQQAIGSYSKAIQLDPKFPMAWYERAGDFSTLGRYEQALSDINEFLKMAPDNDAGLNLRGNVYARMNRPDAAVENFNAAIAANPLQHLAYANRGQAYEVMGRMTEAEADYRKSISINAAYPASHYYLASLLNERKDNDAALAAILKAITLRPQEANFHARAAKIYLSMDRDPEGLAEAEKVLAADDRNTDGWIFKASALSNMKEFDRSIATMTDAIQKFPDNYLLYAVRGFVYKQQGKTAEAAADEAKARALGTK